MKVLNLVGIADDIKLQSSPLAIFRDSTAAGETIGVSELPKTFEALYDQPAMGIRRTELNERLRDSVQQLGVDVREGWELLRVEENETSVTAFFDGDRSVQGSFLIGCDGIKSSTRSAILRYHNLVEGSPSYTGLTQASRAFGNP